MNIHKILPVFAMVTGAALAVINSAFKEQQKNKNGDTLYSFEYNPPSGATHPYSQANVENVANWQYTPSSPSCLGSDRACSIQVPVSFVDNPGTAPTLDSTIEINATNSSPNVAYVNTTAAGADGSISNQSN